MAYYFPEGAQVQFSNTLGAAITVSAATNANPTVLTTSAAHGLTTGDEVLFTSGWEDATDNIFRVTVLTSTTLSLQGLDATNTGFYPAGSGGGSLYKVTGWTTVPQILTVSTTGGDARFTTVSPMAKRNDINIPTGFNPTSTSLTMGHDPANATYQTMLGLSRTQAKCAIKTVLTGGASIYSYGYLSVSEAPQLNRNQVNQVSAAMTALGRVISYA